MLAIFIALAHVIKMVCACMSAHQSGTEKVQWECYCIIRSYDLNLTIEAIEHNGMTSLISKKKHAINQFDNQCNVSFLNSCKMNSAYHVKITSLFALNVLYTVLDNTMLNIFKLFTYLFCFLSR